jgi:hypothetical protein
MQFYKLVLSYLIIIYLLYMGAQRVLEFDENNILFLLLNVVGHNPIHDLGKLTDKNRWKQRVDDIINRMQPLLADIDVDNNDNWDKRKIRPFNENKLYDFKNVLNQFSENKEIFGTKIVSNCKTSSEEGTLDDLIFDYFHDLRISMTLNLFMFYFNNFNNNAFISLYDICYEICFIKFNSNIIISTHLKDNDDTNLLNELILLTSYLHDYILNKVNLNLPVTNIHKIVEYRFQIEYPFLNVKYTIENDLITPSLKEIYTKIDLKNTMESFYTSKYLYSSIVTEKNNEQNLNLLNFTENIFNKTDHFEITELQKYKVDIINATKIMQNFFKEKSDINEKTFQANKDIIIINYTAIFNFFGLKDVNKNINTFKEFLPTPQKSQYINIEDLISVNISRIFLKKYKNLKNKLYDQILKDKKRQFEKNISMSSGEISPRDKATVNTFISYIAKSALFLTGCCDENGKILIQTKGITEEEVDILHAIAGRNDTEWTLGNQNPDTDLDGRLFYYLKKNRDFFNIDKKPPVDKTLITVLHNNPSKSRYVINNASSVSNNSLYSYSSVIDGMSQSKFNLNNSMIESGNIDFIIKNESNVENQKQFYNGNLEIQQFDNSSSANIQITLDVKLKMIHFFTSLIIDVRSSNELKTHIVLTKTFESILAKIKTYDKDIFSKPDIFKELFNIGVKEIKTPSNNFSNSHSHPHSIFTALFKELLFKGVGDIFQEVNAVVKYGGYSKSNYKHGSSVLPVSFHGNGDTIRCFMTNNRVSIARFLFLKKEGKKCQINQKSFGSYISFDNDTNLGISYNCIDEIQNGGTIKISQKNKLLSKLNYSSISKNKTKKIKIGKNLTINIHYKK